MTLENVTVAVNINLTMASERRFGIDELATLSGVSRRTVRYYVQEGLLPSPLGVGRGRHYGREHLDQLLRVKVMQERGLSLGEIHLAVSGGRAQLAEASVPPSPTRSSWTRIEVMPGVELHVAGTVRLPPPGKLLQLAEWCHQHFRREKEGGNA